MCPRKTEKGSRGHTEDIVNSQLSLRHQKTEEDAQVDEQTQKHHRGLSVQIESRAAKFSGQPDNGRTCVLLANSMWDEIELGESETEKKTLRRYYTR